MVKTVALQVHGMRCEGCAATLQTLLGAEPGVKAVTVSHERAEARLMFDPKKTTVEHLISIAERPGFQVAEKPGA